MKSVPTCHREPEAKRSQPLVSGDCFTSEGGLYDCLQSEAVSAVGEWGLLRFARNDMHRLVHLGVNNSVVTQHPEPVEGCKFA